MDDFYDVDEEKQMVAKAKAKAKELGIGMFITTSNGIGCVVSAEGRFCNPGTLDHELAIHTKLHKLWVDLDMDDIYKLCDLLDDLTLKVENDRVKLDRAMGRI